jgi:hypothetical protein
MFSQNSQEEVPYTITYSRLLHRYPYLITSVSEPTRHTEQIKYEWQLSPLRSNNSDGNNSGASESNSDRGGCFLHLDFTVTFKSRAFLPMWDMSNALVMGKVRDVHNIINRLCLYCVLLLHHQLVFLPLLLLV